ncbi:MAG TPA: winged helix-turn-helix domain-containing protein [Sporichthyaceae bacterium]|nr:winged helix-turn-helix domain-containing protein [Sporichthyaceae bacterium]
MTRTGTELDLTAKEFATLELFMRHLGEVLTRTRILDHVLLVYTGRAAALTAWLYDAESVQLRRPEPLSAAPPVVSCGRCPAAVRPVVS